VTVKVLPSLGKPADFTGAVGLFSLDVKASKNTLKSNESTQIKVIIKGSGNIKLFEIPKLIVPSELEMYAPERKQNVRTTSYGLKGSITDNYAIVPEYKGKYVIPSVRFSYFNPKIAAYQNLSSEPIIIEVTEGKILATSSDTASSPNGKQFVKHTNDDFRFIKTQTHFQSGNSREFYGTTLYYLLLFIPFISIPIGIVFGRNRRKKRADISGSKTRKADKLAKKYLSEAKKQLQNKDAFYIALEKALHNFLKAKLKVETAEISQDKITDILQSYQVSNAAILSFIAVLNDCDFARYSPTNDAMMKESYTKASKAIGLINSELSK